MKSAIYLSIIIVNYKSSDLLRACLESIVASNIDSEYETIVVDNDSNDPGLPLIEKQFPRMRFEYLEENRGFAAGNNAGIALASGKVLCLLNPDTEVEPDALQNLLETIKSTDKCGIAGPKIYLPDGSLQNRIMPKEIPRLGNLLPVRFYLNKLLSHSRRFNSYFGANFDYGKMQQVEQVSGACLMIKREVIDKIGLMDDRYFMYFEETDWCLQAGRAGYKILYVPSASIKHFVGGATTNKKRSVRIFYESETRFFKNNYGVGGIIGLYLINLFGFAFRSLMTPFFLLASRDFMKARSNIWALAYHLNPLRFFKVMVS